MKKPSNKYLQRFSENFTATLTRYPAEIAVAAFFTVYMLLQNHSREFSCFHIMWFPQFFTLSFVLNRVLRGKWSRWIYYLSPLSLLVPIFIEWDYFGIYYVVSLVLCPLLVLLSEPQKDNADFARQGYGLLRNLLVSGVLASLGWTLSLAIFFSVEYIFSISEMYVTLADLSVFFYLGVFCITFLFFDRLEPRFESSGKFISALFDFFLSPALLIYTAILYLYFLIITLRFDLPVGGLAYMIFMFCLVAVTSKSFQPLLKTERYRWFYGRFHFFSLPAVLMFWIGSLYRICAYGWTESRVYLFMCGMVMTVTVLMPFIRKADRYLFPVGLTSVLLILLTFVPGIRAKDIGIYSQLHRFNRSLETLKLMDENGHMRPDSYPENFDPEIFERLSACYDYLSQSDPDRLPDGFDPWMIGPCNNITPHTGDLPVFVHFSLTRQGRGVDLSGHWKTLYRVLDYPQNHHHYFQNEPGRLEIYGFERELILEITYREILDKLSETYGADVLKLTESEWVEAGDTLLQIETSSEKIIFNRLDLTEDLKTGALDIASVHVSYYLTR